MQWFVLIILILHALSKVIYHFQSFFFFFVLASFMTTWNKLESSEKGSLNWENIYISLSCRQGHFLNLWLNREVRARLWGHPMWIFWGSMKQTEKVMRGKPVSSLPPQPLHQLLPLGSYPAWVPTLSAFDDKMFHETMSKTNPFLFTLSWSWCSFTAIVTLTKISNVYF